MGFDKMKMKQQLTLFILIFAFTFASCRSKGPHNAVWESKHHPSDELRGDYKKAAEAETKSYKSSKKRYLRNKRKGN
jgi:hypothetical protein